MTEKPVEERRGVRVKSPAAGARVRSEDPLTALWSPYSNYDSFLLSACRSCLQNVFKAITKCKHVFTNGCGYGSSTDGSCCIFIDVNVDVKFTCLHDAHIFSNRPAFMVSDIRSRV